MQGYAQSISCTSQHTYCWIQLHSQFCPQLHLMQTDSLPQAQSSHTHQWVPWLWLSRSPARAAVNMTAVPCPQPAPNLAKGTTVQPYMICNKSCYLILLPSLLVSIHFGSLTCQWIWWLAESGSPPDPAQMPADGCCIPAQTGQPSVPALVLTVEAASQQWNPLPGLYPVLGLVCTSRCCDPD